MRIIAHRGASAEAPENTLAAFRRAIALGAGMIELDVRLTRDGVAVVIHDETLSRTTDGEGRVADAGVADLRRCSAGAWFDARFRGERVPLLAEVFDLVRDRAGINVEIKAEPGQPEAPREVPSGARADSCNAVPSGARADSGYVRTARAALAVTREAGALGRSLFSCFDPAALEALRREGGDIRLALLTGPSSFPTPCASSSPEAARRVMNRMEEWGALALEAACVDQTLVSRRLVEDLHRRGWAVHVFTVDEEALAERLEAMGVDGLFTNDPARLLRRWPSAPSGTHR